MFSRELTEEEAREWREILNPIPTFQVVAAFKDWNRSSLYFPKPTQILELVARHKGNNQVTFRACELNGCIDGWVRVFAGNTIGSEHSGPKPVDPKIGAVKRCQCFYEWAGK